MTTDNISRNTSEPDGPALRWPSDLRPLTGVPRLG
jgi:hypothetical protein